MDTINQGTRAVARTSWENGTIVYMTLKSRFGSFWANNNPFANILPERQQRRSSEAEKSSRRGSTSRRVSNSISKKVKINNLLTGSNDDARSTTSENSGKSGNSANSNEQGSTIAFGLMSTMAVRPILEHVAPDTQLKQVDAQLSEIRTTTG